MTTPQHVRDALDSDLDRLGWTEYDLGRRLGVTQQAVNKWRRLGLLPLSKYKAAVEVLGQDSALARIGIEGLVAAKQARAKAFEQAVQDGVITSEQAAEAIYRSQSEPGAVLRDLRRTRGMIGLPTKENPAVPPATGYSHARFALQRANVADTDAWRRLLPPDLAQYAVKGLRGGVDYLSPRLALEVRHGHPQTSIVPVSAAIVRLAAAKARNPQLRAVLAIVGQGAIANSSMLADAKTLGVESVNLPDDDALVSFIAQVDGEAVPVYAGEDGDF